VVVDGEPGRRDLRLPGDGHPVGGRHEAGPHHGPGEDELLRHAAVTDLDLEAAPVAQRAPRRDDELLAEAHPPRAPPVDRDALDVEPDQVEVQAAQVLGRLRLDVGIPVETVGRGVVVDLKVIRAHVVAAVAVPRVVAVPDPRGPGDARAPIVVVRERGGGSAREERQAHEDRRDAGRLAAGCTHVGPAYPGGRTALAQREPSR
jgi:hypothetical protein